MCLFVFVAVAEVMLLFFQVCFSDFFCFALLLLLFPVYFLLVSVFLCVCSCLFFSAWYVFAQMMFPGSESIVAFFLGLESFVTFFICSFL